MGKSNNIFVAVSGGPDSMYLLFTLKNIYKNKIINALHVNYNFRSESISEKEKLKKYCIDNNIIFDCLEVDENVKKKYHMYKNKQDMARKIRYDYFESKTINEQQPTIYVAHHKDDFLETAIMQKEKSNDYFFYGIKEESMIKKLLIIRPLLNVWKDEIIFQCNKNKITFSIDKSNFSLVYKRNKIRKKLSFLSKEEKEEKINIFYQINNENKAKYLKIEKIFNEWKSNNFSTFFYKNIDAIYKNNIIYMYLSKSNYELNISKTKIDGIVEFIEKNNKGKNFRLKENIFLLINEKKEIETKVE